MSLRSQAKSATPYVLGTAKLSLKILKSLSSAIPVPWVNTAVSAATQVIEIAEVGCLCFIYSMLSGLRKQSRLSIRTMKTEKY
jgi:hypothetical protein